VGVAKKRAVSILSELLKVTSYNGVKRYYGRPGMREATFRGRTLDIAYELGMCQALTSTSNQALTLYTIICKMIEWSSRTYEGKNVPFGIVIDFDKKAEKGSADYLHFLGNDSSAVFTDGIFTGILLDQKGKILTFLTKGSVSPVEKSLDDEREILVPYQYADIAKYCKGNAIGVIVLTNGEILLIKNEQLCFAKRGRKWIYFDWPRVELALKRYFDNAGINKKDISNRIKTIYMTLLDVSFAHTGGCLAILLPQKESDLEKGAIIKDRIDLFEDGKKSLPNLSAESREKIAVLTYLLRNSQKSMNSFFDVERQLRREILGLDGATVVSLDGKFYCAGAIVAVGGGSTGGGRTAAAKRLAEYGVGIKISEDGYIEAFGLPLDKQASRFQTLFTLK